MNKYNLIANMGTSILVIVLIFDLLNDWGNFVYLVICIGLLIAISTAMNFFKPKEWKFCITQKGLEWETPSKAVKVLFSDIESIFFCNRENKIILVSKSGESYAVPPKCMTQNINAINQIREIAPNLITHEVETGSVKAPK